jgi:hypothetical protein
MNKNFNEVRLDELQNEEMYCFVAPDGSAQLTTLCPDFTMCIGMAGLMARSGIGKTAAEMFAEGYSILPVKVTMIQNGTAEDGFQAAKKQMV